MLALTLRFDGSFRGGSGGAGAVLLSSETASSRAVHWQGARFLSSCANSAAAEYEGLLLGLDAAVQAKPTSLRVEGDCRLVLTQAAGTARPRKLGKQHKLVLEKLAQLSPHLEARPKFASIPRDENSHADALSRAAVEAMENLHRGAILAAARSGQTRSALGTLERASRDGVRIGPLVYEELLRSCHQAQDWRTLLSAYAAAQRDPRRRTQKTYEYVIDAYEALGATRRGADARSKQLAMLVRQQTALAKQTERALAVAAVEAEVAAGVAAARASRAKVQQLRRLSGESDEEEEEEYDDEGEETRCCKVNRGGIGSVSGRDRRQRSPPPKTTQQARDALEVQRQSEARGAPAGRWRLALETAAGGESALEGSVPSATPRLLELADRLAGEGGLSLYGEREQGRVESFGVS